MNTAARPVYKVGSIVGLVMLGMAGWTLGEPAGEPSSLEAEHWLWDRAHLTGDWGNHRDRLRESGVDPYAVYHGEVLSLIDGGRRRGTQLNGLLDFGVDLDLERLAGWRGGSVHTGFLWYEGSDLSGDRVGNFNGVSNIIMADTVRVFTAWYEQTLREGRYRLKLGQLIVEEDFMTTAHRRGLSNAAFDELPTTSGNFEAPVFPLGAPGVWGRAEPVEPWFLQAGVYAGNAGPDRRSNHGFQWRLGGDAGYVGLAETGIRYELAESPGSLKAGGFYHTGRFRDFRTGERERGNRGLYLTVDQELFRNEAGQATLGVFGRAGVTSPTDRNVVGHYLEGGLNWVGPLPGRADDVVAFGVSWTDFRESYRDWRRQNGQRVSSSETVLEWAYEATVLPAFVARPSLQWILNPHESRDDAVVVGIRGEWVF